MKSPLGKLKRFGFHKSDAIKEKRESQSQLDDLAQAALDLQQMRDCYDSLFSAAAATANSAYEFSESLREMGSCLLEKASLHDDEESGSVLLMLGKVQFELQRLVDSYRSHIILTITNPSECFLNELRTVEEMKRQCDEKRNVYEYMIAQQKEKGRSKGGKYENFSPAQLKTAHDEYDEQSTLCAFRLKSLKQGQSRSLLTQASRHHAAQLNFFRKGLKSLEAVDQKVRPVTEHQHIDYQISGVEDEEYDAEGDHNSYDANEGRELSFSYRLHGQGPEISTIMNSMEVEQVGTVPQFSAADDSESNMERAQDLQFFRREHRGGSHSAPIFADKEPKSDPAEKARQVRPSSTTKSSTYVLPTPAGVKSSVPPRTSGSDLQTGSASHGVRAHSLWHSSPLEQKKHEKDYGDECLPGAAVVKTRSGFKEGKTTSSSTQLPPPLVEGHSLPHPDTSNFSDTKKIKRQAFSGPLNNKSSSTKHVIPASGPLTSSEFSQNIPGRVSWAAISSSPPKVSPSTSPPLVSSPRISELHELPRPPGYLAATKPTKSAISGHSAPLGPRTQDFSEAYKITSPAPSTASPLPTPPLIVPRSFSIPSSGQRAMSLQVGQLFDLRHQNPDMIREVASPPLTPISLASINRIATISEVNSNPGQITGGS